MQNSTMEKITLFALASNPLLKATPGQTGITQLEFDVDYKALSEGKLSGSLSGHIFTLTGEGTHYFHMELEGADAVHFLNVAVKDSCKLL
jgi:hypothetical protein